ncbi:MAG: hypothetical protein KC592_12090 [Nitrospira sp.]|nr:hypothetical protein [Nitrospira sp.]
MSGRHFYRTKARSAKTNSLGLDCVIMGVESLLQGANRGELASLGMLLVITYSKAVGLNAHPNE